MEGKTYGLGYENVFLEELEPREFFDDRRPVAPHYEVDRGLHGRARGCGVEERGDVYQCGALEVSICA